MDVTEQVAKLLEVVRLQNELIELQVEYAETKRSYDFWQQALKDGTHRRDDHNMYYNVESAAAELAKAQGRREAASAAIKVKKNQIEAALAELGALV
ncbi:MAG: hypothetical protein HYS89_00650 [Candidatus Colwellbacteria bacterium]|nr:hypothetical protein [Candidatus Colwellbacteria bacterium]